MLLGFLYYSLLADWVKQLPLFIIFIAVVTPAIYFLQNAVTLQLRHLPTIAIITILSIFIHPLVALAYACLVTIYDISSLIQPAIAEFWYETRESQSVSRKSGIVYPPESQQSEAIKEKNENPARRGDCVKIIEEDVPY